MTRSFPRPRRAAAILTTTAAVGLVGLAVPPTAQAAPGDLARVSVSGAGSQANVVCPLGDSECERNAPAVSADGRFVAWSSHAVNLVAGDTNASSDVFVRDRATGSTTRVSVSTGGAQGNGTSLWASISADGRYVAFASDASNLVPGDTNGMRDVFVRDRAAYTTTRVSVSSGGVQGNGSSPPYFDRQFAISGDGRYVAFVSDAWNLVPGDAPGSCDDDGMCVGSDVFLRDVKAGTTERVSISGAGAPGDAASMGEVAISGDGRHVAFVSLAANLVPGDTNRVCGSGEGCPFGSDVFVRDRQARTTTRVSVSSAGVQTNYPYSAGSPAISADGRYVAFASGASNLVPGDTEPLCVEFDCEEDVFVHDLSTRATTRVSVSSSGAAGDGWSGSPSLSGDGRFVVFSSAASNLVPGDTNGGCEMVDYPCLNPTDVFVRDRALSTTSRVSVRADGTQGDGSSGHSYRMWQAPWTSADGRVVAFGSEASNLVPGDTNGASDVFVKELAVPVAPVTVVSDSFARTVSGGWGSAPTGGAYTLTGAASSFSTNGSAGRIVSSVAGSDRMAAARGVSVRDMTATVTVTPDKIATGSGQYVWLSLRDTAAGRYRAALALKASGAIDISLQKVVGSTFTELGRQTISGLTYTAGTTLNLRADIAGGTSTTLRTRAWRAGTTEPTSWQLSRTDTTSPITGAGGVGVGSWLSTNTTNLPVTHTFDNLTATTTSPFTAASDTFARTVSGGWGTAPVGGAYTLTGPAGDFTTTGSTGRIATTTAGTDRVATLRQISLRDSTTTVQVTPSKLAAGGAPYVWLTSRDTTSGRYRAAVVLNTNGTLTVSLQRVVGTKLTELLRQNVSGVTYAAGTALTLKTQTSGTLPTVLRAKVWRTGTTEPATWQASTFDYTPINGAGGTGIGTWAPTTTSNLPHTHTLDNLTVTAP